LGEPPLGGLGGPRVGVLGDGIAMTGTTSVTANKGSDRKRRRMEGEKAEAEKARQSQVRLTAYGSQMP